MISRIPRTFLAGAALAVATTSMPAMAQEVSDARVRKLESEIRALQRKVFPGGDGRYFEAEITAPANTARPAGSAATTAVTDILARMDALEGSVQRLTAQTEENTNALRDMATRLAAMESGTGVQVTSGNAAPVDLAARTAPAGAAQPAAAPAASSAVAARSVPATPAPAAARPSPERIAAVQAIAKPQTDDPGDDEYSYGFRLWDAGFYPEAQQQLSLFVEKYPNHARTSYGRNLLGRAYLDDNKPREAAPWFLRNYQTDKQGARAPDSLLYLAQTMIAVNDTGRACIALAEFGETYPALAAGRLSDEYQASLRKVDCD